MPEGKGKRLLSRSKICATLLLLLLTNNANDVFSKIPPSKYWQAALHLTQSTYEDAGEESNQTGILIADFENGFGSWKRGGNAFEKARHKNSNDIKSVVGYSGMGWVSSFNKVTKKSFGSLSSPKLKVNNRFLNFLVGGGQFNEVGVELWADGKE